MIRRCCLWFAWGAGTLLSAHPEWKEASCTGVIDDAGLFAFTIKFDVPSFYVGKVPKVATLAELDALMFVPATRQTVAETAPARFRQGLHVTADGHEVPVELVAFPALSETLALMSKQGEADRYPALLNAKFKALLPAFTTKVEISFPTELGPLFVNLRKNMDAQVVMGVAPGTKGEFIIGENHPIAVTGLGTFLQEGFEHVIPAGWDHCLFMLAMFLGAASLTEALKRSLVFTGGHSITLTLVALGSIGQVSVWIEPIIALTIGVGGWLAYRGTASNRQMLIVPAIFGLVHGLGFAAAVSDKLSEWSRASIVQVLIGFNLGVELAQVSVILVAAGVLWLISRDSRLTQPFRQFACLSVAVAGFVVMAYRAWGLLAA